MRRLWMLVLLLMLLLGLGGCAMFGQDSKERQAQYDAYLAVKSAMIDAMKEADPLVEAEWTDSGGKPMKLKVRQQFQIPNVEQIKNDESYAFWGGIAGNLIGGAFNLGSVWIDSHYDVKSSEAMWGALGGGLGGGIKIDNGGGSVSLDSSGNYFRQTGGAGSAFSLDALKQQSVQGESSATFQASTATATPSDSMNDSRSYSQTGGEDSNNVQ